MSQRIKSSDKTQNYLQEKIPTNPEIRNLTSNILLCISQLVSKSPEFQVKKQRNFFILEVYTSRPISFEHIVKIHDQNTICIIDIKIVSGLREGKLTLQMFLSDNNNHNIRAYEPVEEKDYIPFDTEPDFSILKDQADREKAMRITKVLANMNSTMPYVECSVARQTENEYTLSFDNMPVIRKQFIDFFLQKFNHILNKIEFSSKENKNSVKVTINKSNSVRVFSYLNNNTSKKRRVSFQEKSSKRMHHH